MTELVWVVVRQDDNGNRYRVGRYATPREAEEVVGTLVARGRRQLYLIEHIDRHVS